MVKPVPMAEPTTADPDALIRTVRRIGLFRSGFISPNGISPRLSDSLFILHLQRLIGATDWAAI
jgi:hypothetical protein